MTYPFELIPLPYAHDALEPLIDTRTMELHHGAHLKTFVDNLNNTLAGHPSLHGQTVEELLLNLEKLPQEIQTPVRNFAGGVYNHNMYFAGMAPNAAPLADGELKVAIEKAFGSVEEFLAQYKVAGLSVFGSGWAYLVSDADGNLSIFKTPNQDTPIPAGLTLVVIMDVWEHAYYLLRQNRRAEYIDNWFKVINWQIAETRYANR
ncbi:MAG: superoxide dismutase [Defluviitaleaceae bacterium]|nr:superoxide dismutase [Defluviitaleaceae bacterium]